MPIMLNEKHKIQNYNNYMENCLETKQNKDWKKEKITICHKCLERNREVQENNRGHESILDRTKEII